MSGPTCAIPHDVAMQRPVVSTCPRHVMPVTNINIMPPRLHWPWHTDRSLHYTPVHVLHTLAARGCNTRAAAEYSNLQLGGASTRGTQTAECFFQVLHLGAMHSTSKWGTRVAEAKTKSTSRHTVCTDVLFFICCAGVQSFHPRLPLVIPDRIPPSSLPEFTFWEHCFHLCSDPLNPFLGDLHLVFSLLSFNLKSESSALVVWAGMWSGKG